MKCSADIGIEGNTYTDFSTHIELKPICLGQSCFPRLTRFPCFHIRLLLALFDLSPLFWFAITISMVFFPRQSIKQEINALLRSSFDRKR